MRRSAPAAARVADSRGPWFRRSCGDSSTAEEEEGGEVNVKTVSLIIDTLRVIFLREHDADVRLRSLERVLENFPEAKQGYEAHLEILRRDPGVEANRLSRLERLEALRAALLQDQQDQDS